MLCFFSIPIQLITYYQTYIFPIVEKFGFQPITTNDIIMGSNIYLKVSGLIRKSSIVIADLSSDSVKHAVYLAETEKKPTIVITEFNEDDVLNKIGNSIEKYILMRPQYPEPHDDIFKIKFESFLENITKELQTTLPEPLRLVEKKEYCAGLISAFIILETKLRDVLIKSDIDFEKSRLTFSESLYLANRLHILSLEKNNTRFN